MTSGMYVSFHVYVEPHFFNSGLLSPCAAARSAQGVKMPPWSARGNSAF